MENKFNYDLDGPWGVDMEDESLDDIRESTDKIVDWWMEDYSFEALLEQFDLTPKDAFFALVKTDEISRDMLEAYLTSDS